VQKERKEQQVNLDALCAKKIGQLENGARFSKKKLEESGFINERKLPVSPKDVEHSPAMLLLSSVALLFPAGASRKRCS